MRTVDDLRRLLARRASEGLGATSTSLPAPTMTMDEIAAKLAALWTETYNASISGATTSDGLAWGNLRADLTSKAGNLLDLAFQVAEQEQAMQAEIASLRAELARAPAAQVPSPLAAAIAVGTAAAGGILGFVGGRASAGSRWWPWSK